MAQNRLRLETDSLTTIHWVAIVMAAVSAAIHIGISIGFLPQPLGLSLLLSGLGFVGAIGLVLVNYRRRLVYAAGIPYTGVQIVIWYWVNHATTGVPITEAGILDVVDKTAQVVLIALLVVLLTSDEA